MIEIYTDGACRGNPGPAASSFLVVKNGKVQFFASRYIGEATNNIAEYQAIIDALSYAVNKGLKKIILTSDSKLVISQINGEYKLKAEHLRPFYDKVLLLSSSFTYKEFKHAKRENYYIKVVDKLCNIMLDLQK